MLNDFTAPTIARFAGLHLPTATIPAWLDQQIAHCSDPAFAALFSDHLDLPGIHPTDYLHRIVATRTGHLLGGIRFYGHDITKPFVDLLAWTGPIDLPAWRTAIANVWAAFDPPQFRILSAGEPAFAAFPIDQTIHAGRAGIMAEQPLRPTVTLQPCHAPEAAAAQAARWHQDFAATNPTLAAELHIADAAELTECHTNGSLDYIMIDGTQAGLLATAPGTIDWLHGHIVIEEILASSHHGHGHAAYAQRRLAVSLAATDPQTLLLGTIHHTNIASYRTATTAGRPAIMDYRFIPLPACSS